MSLSEGSGLLLIESIVVIAGCSNYLEPTLGLTSAILRAVVVTPVANRSSGRTRGQSPLINHNTTTIEAVVFTIALPVFFTCSVLPASLLTVGFEVEPVIVIIIFTLLIIINGDLLPTGLHGTVFPGTAVIFSVFPTVIASCQFAILGYPAIQHLTIIIESIFLAINGFEFCASAVIASLVSFTALLHIVVMILSRIIIIILILVNNLNPGVGNHNTVAVYVVGVTVIINEFVGSHCATLFGIQPEPVVSRFLPSVFYSATIFVVVVPGTIFLNPTLSCERSHSTTDS